MTEAPTVATQDSMFDTNGDLVPTHETLAADASRMRAERASAQAEARAERERDERIGRIGTAVNTAGHLIRTEAADLMSLQPTFTWEFAEDEIRTADTNVRRVADGATDVEVPTTAAVAVLETKAASLIPEREQRRATLEEANQKQIEVATTLAAIDTAVKVKPNESDLTPEDNARALREESQSLVEVRQVLMHYSEATKPTNPSREVSIEALRKLVTNEKGEVKPEYNQLVQKLFAPKSGEGDVISAEAVRPGVVEVVDKLLETYHKERQAKEAKAKTPEQRMDAQNEAFYNAMRVVARNEEVVKPLAQNLQRIDREIAQYQSMAQDLRALSVGIADVHPEVLQEGSVTPLVAQEMRRMRAVDNRSLEHLRDLDPEAAKKDDRTRRNDATYYLPTATQVFTPGSPTYRMVLDINKVIAKGEVPNENGAPVEGPKAVLVTPNTPAVNGSTVTVPNVVLEANGNGRSAQNGLPAEAQVPAAPIRNGVPGREPLQPMTLRGSVPSEMQSGDGEYVGPKAPAVNDHVREYFDADGKYVGPEDEREAVMKQVAEDEARVKTDPTVEPKKDETTGATPSTPEVDEEGLAANMEEWALDKAREYATNIVKTKTGNAVVRFFKSVWGQFTGKDTREIERISAEVAVEFLDLARGVRTAEEMRYVGRAEFGLSEYQSRESVLRVIQLEQGFRKLAGNPMPDERLSLNFNDTQELVIGKDANGTEIKGTMQSAFSAAITAARGNDEAAKAAAYRTLYQVVSAYTAKSKNEASPFVLTLNTEAKIRETVENFAQLDRQATNAIDAVNASLTIGLASIATHRRFIPEGVGKILDNLNRDSIRNAYLRRIGAMPEEGGNIFQRGWRKAGQFVNFAVSGGILLGVPALGKLAAGSALLSIMGPAAIPVAAFVVGPMIGGLWTMTKAKVSGGLSAGKLLRQAYGKGLEPNRKYGGMMTAGAFAQDQKFQAAYALGNVENLRAALQRAETSPEKIDIINNIVVLGKNDLIFAQGETGENFLALVNEAQQVKEAIAARQVEYTPEQSLAAIDRGLAQATGIRIRGLAEEINPQEYMTGIETAVKKDINGVVGRTGAAAFGLGVVTAFAATALFSDNPLIDGSGNGGREAAAAGKDAAAAARPSASDAVENMMNGGKSGVTSLGERVENAATGAGHFNFGATNGGVDVPTVTIDGTQGTGVIEGARGIELFDGRTQVTDGWTLQNGAGTNQDLEYFTVKDGQMTLISKSELANLPADTEVVLATGETTAQFMTDNNLAPEDLRLVMATGQKAESGGNMLAFLGGADSNIAQVKPASFTSLDGELHQGIATTAGFVNQAEYVGIGARSEDMVITLAGEGTPTGDTNPIVMAIQEPNTVAEKAQQAATAAGEAVGYPGRVPFSAEDAAGDTWDRMSATERIRTLGLGTRDTMAHIVNHQSALSAAWLLPTYDNAEGREVKQKQKKDKPGNGDGKSFIGRTSESFKNRGKQAVEMLRNAGRRVGIGRSNEEGSTSAPLYVRRDESSSASAPAVATNGTAAAAAAGTSAAVAAAASSVSDASTSTTSGTPSTGTTANQTVASEGTGTASEIKTTELNGDAIAKVVPQPNPALRLDPGMEKQARDEQFTREYTAFIEQALQDRQFTEGTGRIGRIVENGSFTGSTAAAFATVYNAIRVNAQITNNDLNTISSALTGEPVVDANGNITNREAFERVEELRQWATRAIEGAGQAPAQTPAVQLIRMTERQREEINQRISREIADQRFNIATGQWYRTLMDPIYIGNHTSERFEEFAKLARTADGKPMKIDLAAMRHQAIQLHDSVSPVSYADKYGKQFADITLQEEVALRTNEPAGQAELTRVLNDDRTRIDERFVQRVLNVPQREAKRVANDLQRVQRRVSNLRKGVTFPTKAVLEQYQARQAQVAA